MIDWSQVVQEHGPLVWRTAQRLLNHEADAADCFQQTFISALEVARREPVRHWPALLRQLATARALERLRQRHREHQRLTVLPDDSSPDARAVEPVEAAASNELAARLREALAELDPKQAQVVCLSYMEGLTYQEIAEQLGMPPSTVGVLLHRARASLRERLRTRDQAPAAK